MLQLKPNLEGPEGSFRARISKSYALLLQMQKEDSQSLTNAEHPVKQIEHPTFDVLNALTLAFLPRLGI